MMPGSAADAKPKAQIVESDDDIMIIVKDQRFMISMVEALSLAGTITAICAERLRSGK